MRTHGRAAQSLRPVTIQPDFVGTAAGSCLIAFGGTRVICTASVEESVPPFLQGRNSGWLTAEYAMLPASTGRRKQRDGIKRDSRGVEISRLIGRSLRQAVDLTRLGARTITIDCDVLEADGGTRTASITGGFVALCLAVHRLIEEGKLKESPVARQVAAVSAGIVDNQAVLDLDYPEDSTAQADVNVVMNDAFDLIELQGTGEGRAFTRGELDNLLQLAQQGIEELMRLQREALGDKQYVIAQPQTLVVASNNAHKVMELKTMLGDRYRVVSMREAGVDMDVDETGDTFEANAILKAEAVRNATGYLSLADDSGLEVPALHGAPGVHSARYAGEHGDDAANNRLLIGNLKNVPQPWQAQFVSVLALASPFAPTRTFEGICPGTIVADARGESGFGYDPHFLYETGLTFAQMTAQQKNAVSHRARAMEKLKEALACAR